MNGSNPFSALEGEWIYRSFRNLTKPVQELKEILFGQGDLTLTVPADGLIRDGKLSFGPDYPMLVQGQAYVTPGNTGTVPPVVVALQAFGVEGTKTAGWVYAYQGYLVPTWPNGIDQRTALAGTVIRVVPHGPTSPAGVVASFVAVKKD
jgi:hypothetical protein